MDARRKQVLVLIVEDDDERAIYFRRWLEGPKVRLLRVKTGDAALRSVQERYDLILLDHDLDKHHPMGRLAKVNGSSIVDRLITTRANRTTRIVIHSMNPGARTEMMKRLHSNGFDVELQPFADWTPEWARALITEVIEEWEAERE